MSSKTLIAITLAIWVAAPARAQLNSWSAKVAKTTPVTRTAGGGVNGILYAVGGLTGANTTTASVEAYDPALDQWSLATNAPLALCDHSVGVSKSKLYIAGGQGAERSQRRVAPAVPDRRARFEPVRAERLEREANR